MSNSNISEIKLLILDVDGVLTDGGIYMGNDGTQMRRFHAHDGQGIKEAQAHGIEVGIITGSHESDLIHARAKMLGISNDLLSIACQDKLAVLTEWVQSRNLQMQEVAYVGDDIPDIPCMRSVGCAACPADAMHSVNDTADVVLSLGGGQGCVREFIDMILASRSTHSSTETH